MIRNVVVGRLRAAENAEQAEADLAQLRGALAGIAGLSEPGLLEMRTGFDAGLRDGGYSFAITNDWVDENAYRAYDVEPEHNVYRNQIAEVCEHIARVQFVL